MTLLPVARAALASWGLAGQPLRPVAESFNTIYRVTASDGPYALRVAPGECVHRVASAEAEARWTAHLAARGLRVPLVVRTPDGAASVAIEAADGPRRCMLLTWVPGRPPQRPVGTDHAYRLGALAARLHDAAGTDTDDAGGALDGRSALLFELPDRLPEAGRHAVVFRAAHVRAQAALDRLWATADAPARLLHGDLTPSNVVTFRATLRPLDFQDITRGHEQQDIAASLYGLAHDDPSGRTAEPFRAGYESVRPWPPFPGSLLADLLLARRLAIVNLTLTLRRPGWPERLEQHAAALADPDAFPPAVVAAGVPCTTSAGGKRRGDGKRRAAGKQKLPGPVARA